MIPESASKKTVALYKAKKFPYEWEFKKNIFEDKTLVDSTLLFYNGKWWLFASGSSHPFVSTNDQLFLYYSDDLYAHTWTPHPRNPVVRHIANCRPAGRVFERQGVLYRPAQDNASRQYGYGLKLNAIEVLNEKEYREREVLNIRPEGLALKAIHHIDFSESFIVLDGVVD
jgi:hypothetical protein